MPPLRRSRTRSENGSSSNSHSPSVPSCNSLVSGTDSATSRISGPRLDSQGKAACYIRLRGRGRCVLANGEHSCLLLSKPDWFSVWQTILKADGRLVLDPFPIRLNRPIWLSYHWGDETLPSPFAKITVIVAARLRSERVCVQVISNGTFNFSYVERLSHGH